MTPKRNHKEIIRSSSRQTDPIQVAIDYGADVSMLIENLKRTPAERVKKHQIALNTAMALRKAQKAMNRPRDKEAILQLETIRKLRSNRKNRS